MNDELELEDGVEVEEQSTEASQAQLGVTREDMAEFAETIGNKVAQAVSTTTPVYEEEEEIDETAFSSVAEFNKFLAKRDAEIEARLTAKFQAMQAPIQIQAGLAKVADGLDDVGRAYVDNMLADLSPEQKALALTDSKYSDLLRRAARDAMNEKGGRIPTSEGVSARGNDSLSPDDRQDVKELMNAFGYTQKQAIERIQQAKKAVGR